MADRLVIAGDHAQQPLVLDPVSATLWEGMDGTYPVGEMASDLAEATGVLVPEARRQAQWLVAALAIEGFLAEPQPVDPILPRWIYPDVPPDSCLGRRLGLGRSRHLQVADAAGEPFRIASSDPVILAEVGHHLEVEEPDDVARETFILRVARSASGRPRLQQLFDAMGNPLYAGRDLDLAKEALDRTAHARRQTEGVWLQGVTLHRGDAAVIIHPALRDLVVDHLRPDLRNHAIDFIPAGLVELTAQLGLVTAPSPATGASSARWRVAGVLMPETPGPVERLRMAVHLARRWDQDHLDRTAELIDGCDVAEVTAKTSSSMVVEDIDAMLRSA